MDQNEETNQDHSDVFLSDLVQALADAYEPVTTIKELDEYISTEDVYDAIQDIYPSEGLFGYGAGTIAKLMRLAGFKFTLLPSSTPKYVWLIRRR